MADAEQRALEMVRILALGDLAPHLDALELPGANGD
jgi:hypothetical protein